MADQRSLKVVQMLPALVSGGVERGTVELSRELVQRGHTSIVISAGGALVADLEAHGGEHITWDVGAKSPLTARWIGPLRRLLAQRCIDVLHVRSRVPAWVAWLACRSLPAHSRPHFVTTAHGLYSVNRYSEIMSRGERVIAISRTVQRHLERSYPRMDRERVRLIYRGVDETEFPFGHRPGPEWVEHWRQSFPKLREGPVITLAGRMTRCKGHLEFIELADRLRHDLPGLQALIVGGVDRKRQAYAEELHQAIRRKRLTNVTFTGQRSDVRDIFASSDVVLSLTSDPPEAFGRTTLEALSMGVPVVGYDHGGTGEILEQIFPFGLVPPGDLDCLAARVLAVLTERPAVPRSDQFRRETMVDQTLAVYREVA